MHLNGVFTYVCQPYAPSSPVESFVQSSFTESFPFVSAPPNLASWMNPSQPRRIMHHALCVMMSDGPTACSRGFEIIPSLDTEGFFYSSGAESNLSVDPFSEPRYEYRIIHP